MGDSHFYEEPFICVRLFSTVPLFPIKCFSMKSKLSPLRVRRRRPTFVKIASFCDKFLNALQRTVEKIRQFPCNCLDNSPRSVTMVVNP